MGLREQAVNVAESAAHEAHRVLLFLNLGKLAADTSEIGADLHDNQKQINYITDSTGGQRYLQ